MSLFADDMILCTENPKDTSSKLLELINAGYTIDTQKYVEFLYTNRKIRREIKETVPFTIVSKKKIPRNKSA